MRLSILLVAAHFAVLGCGSSGSAAGWSGLARQKSTAAGGRRVFDRQERRSHYCCSVLAFGGSPSSRAAERELDATEAAAAAAAAAGVLVFTFEDFYQTLADVACLVYPREANDKGGDRSGRAMHRLLLEGVLPLAADSRTRVWSPR